MAFPATVVSIAQAREFVRSEAAAYPREVVDRAELIASELATNAVRHTGSPYSLSITTDDTLRIEVFDRNLSPPVLQPKNPHAIGGRGLRVIAALAREWGYQSRSNGKVVWAEISPT
jgi:anti-sigma regulatory factor (Ser/Thr protein kinase)